MYFNNLVKLIKIKPLLSFDFVMDDVTKSTTCISDCTVLFLSYIIQTDNLYCIFLCLNIVIRIQSVILLPSFGAAKLNEKFFNQGYNQLYFSSALTLRNLLRYM